MDPIGRPYESTLDMKVREIEEKIRRQKKDEAYQSALNDPLQAHLFEEHNESAIDNTVEPTSSNSPLPQLHQNQTQTLRRSARIREQGVTRKYGDNRSKTRKCDIGSEDTNLDPVLQAKLLQALREEGMATVPLQQELADWADIHCRIIDLLVVSGVGFHSMVSDEEEGDPT